jgi:predicted nuclease of predicted toxin-antitoxin system
VRFIADQNVPESVVQFFLERGDEVRRARDLMLAEAPDEVLAAVADKTEAVILTWDKDLRSLASKMPRGTRTRFRKLGRISFQCNESQGRNRLEQLSELLDFAFQQAQRRKDPRFMVMIGASSVRFEL